MIHSIPRGYSVMELQHARPIKQRPESDVRHCEACGARLARDNYEVLCSPCSARADGEEVCRAVDALRVKRAACEAARSAA